MAALWTKYHPKNLDEMVGNEKTIKQVQALLNKPWEKVPPVLLFTGPEGCGKRTLARIVKNRLLGNEKWQDYHYGESENDFHSRFSLRNPNTGEKLEPDVNVHVVKRIGVDGAKELFEFAKSRSVRFNTRIILCIADADKLPPEVKDRFPMFPVAPLSQEETVQLLQRVCKAEGVMLHEYLLGQIALDSKGIPRRALELLEDEMEMRRPLSLSADMTEKEEKEYLKERAEEAATEDMTPAEKADDLAGKEHVRLQGLVLNAAMEAKAAGEHLTEHELWKKLHPPPYPLTPEGLVQRFLYREGANVRYCTDLDRWLGWDGHRWAMESKKHPNVTGLVQAMLRSIPIESAHLNDKEKDFVAKAFTKVKAVIEQALPALQIKTERLDVASWFFNCLNGTIDLRTGKLQDNSREDWLTKLAPIHFNEDAPCPTWDAFLLHIMDGKPEMVTFLQRVIGAALTKEPKGKVVFFLVGPKHTGKTTFLEVLRYGIFGEYAYDTPPATFEARTDAREASFGYAGFAGNRFITASELTDEQKLNISLLKRLTGLGTVSTRKPYGEITKHRPTYVMFLDTNDAPIIPPYETALWDRIQIIPFKKHVPEDMQAKLLTESAGILRWAVEGCLKWQKTGLAIPEEVTTAKETYKQMTDPIGWFIESCLFKDEKERTRPSHLFQVYSAWQKENKEAPKLSDVKLGKALQKTMAAMGIERTPKNPIYYLCIGIKPEWKKFVKEE